MFTLLVVPVVYLLLVSMAERFGFNMAPPAIALAEEDLEQFAEERRETSNAAL